MCGFVESDSLVMVILPVWRDTDRQADRELGRQTEAARQTDGERDS